MQSLEQAFVELLVLVSAVQDPGAGSLDDVPACPYQLPDFLDCEARLWGHTQ